MRLTPLLILLSLASGASAERPKREIEKSAEKRDRVICKRFTETGSLVRAYKSCKTKADWDRSRDLARQSSVSASCSSIAEGGSCQ